MTGVESTTARRTPPRPTTIATKNLMYAINRLETVLEFEDAKNGKAGRIAEVATEVVRRYRTATAENRQRAEDRAT